MKKKITVTSSCEGHTTMIESNVIILNIFKIKFKLFELLIIKVKKKKNLNETIKNK